MKQHYRSAVEHGGDQISIALGKAERLLKASPKDLAALAYKGALLAMMSQTMPPRQSGIYLQNGVAMMQGVLAQLDEVVFDNLEAYFVTVTGLLRYADITSDAVIATAKLDALLVPARFAMLTDFEAVTVLVLDADISAKAGETTRAHNRIKQAMAQSVGLTTLLRSLTPHRERRVNFS